MTSDEFCPICNQKVETIQHLVWNCGVTNDIWASTSVPTHKWSWLMNNLDQLWEKLVTTLERPDLENVAIILSFIWLKRNNLFSQNLSNLLCVLSMQLCQNMKNSKWHNKEA